MILANQNVIPVRMKQISSQRLDFILHYFDVLICIITQPRNIRETEALKLTIIC
jgi:hypothetical protein